MNTKSASLLIVLLSCLVALAASQDQQRRCYQFTWLGPRYNNQSVFMNATCGDATRLSAGVPCQQPLVVSYDGSWPDVEYIWTHHREEASCALADNDVCAQYTYYFDGTVDNSTYMCTRAVDLNGAAITSGCYQQVNGSSVTRVCFCRSVPGGVPCNNVPNAVPSLFLFGVVILLLTFAKG